MNGIGWYMWVVVISVVSIDAMKCNDFLLFDRSSNYTEENVKEKLSSCGNEQYAQAESIIELLKDADNGARAAEAAGLKEKLKEFSSSRRFKNTAQTRGEIANFLNELLAIRQQHDWTLSDVKKKRRTEEEKRRQERVAKNTQKRLEKTQRARLRPVVLGPVAVTFKDLIDQGKNREQENEALRSLHSESLGRAEALMDKVSSFMDQMLTVIGGLNSRLNDLESKCQRRIGTQDHITQ